MGKKSRMWGLLAAVWVILAAFSFIGYLPNATAEGSWEQVISITKTIEVEPGQEYYAYFDGSTRSLKEIYLPDIETGLSQKAKDALDQVPGWLYPDMVNKFAELGDTVMDVGDYATPIFADMDFDGDLDLSMGSGEGSLSYYENIGTKNKYIFKIDTEMYSYINLNHLVGANKTAMALGDWDADLDNDLLVGNSEGDMIVFENIGTPTQALWNFSAWGYGFTESNSHPAFVDLDNDNDLDVAIGAGDGHIYFYENIGSPEAPQWTYSYNLNTGEDDDRAIAFADLDEDGDFDLTVGDGNFATLYYYRNIGSATQEIWFEDTTMYNGISPEFGTSPAIADLNDDKRLDLVVGGNTGRLYYYGNSGSAQNANWLIWSSYQVVEGFNYYPKDELMKYRDDYHMDRYADLILDAQSKYKDEIGFAIAHMPIENLKVLSYNQSQLIVDNAELIYEIDSYLDYVQVIEKGDYTTTRYKFGEPGNTVERELPRDIYYWYIVHPKITNENVYYVHPNDSDPNHPTDPSNGGRFWREYLFYHADESYPPDNSGAPDDGVDDYPQNIAAPLLKDVLSGVTTLWNGTKHTAPGGRSAYYGDNALVRVSNWVGWTLILNQQEVSDSERPIQPVRIAHHHNGNCGELQDLTVPAARTALIPASGVLLLGEDHVWIEFFENGWHQWDNYWSHAGSIINNFDNYWVGWGERGGSGIYKHAGDDDTWEVTDHYIPDSDISNVTIKIVDINGYPVDGARVLVISYWLKVNIEGYQTEIPFPSIWNYTDSNGETQFKLATQTKADGNHNFTFKIISKVGSFETGKNELQHGQDYTFTYPLEGSVPNPQLDTNLQPNPNPPDPEYRIGASYQVVSSYQRPRNLETGNYHPREIPPVRLPDGSSMNYEGNHVDSFIADSEGFENYLKGYNFDSYEEGKNSNSYSLGFDLPDFENWYFVLSNRDSIETTKVVNINLELLYNVPPFQVKITQPQDGASLNFGETITISGIVTNESNLVSLKLSTDSGSSWTYISQSNGQWTYQWDTSSLILGSYDIEVIATFQSSQNSDSITVELIDSEAPLVNINTPEDYSIFNIGRNVMIFGTVTDNVQVSELLISFDDGVTWEDILPSLSGGTWSYNWKTSGLDIGGYAIKVRASDGYNLGFGSGYYELEDLNPPVISISEPGANNIINIGSIVTILGDAEDNSKIVSLLLSTDSGEHWIDILSTLNDTLWSYDWDTKGLSEGLNTLLLNASDGIFSTIYSVDVNLVDVEAPMISILNPSENSEINIGTTITISGKAVDNVDILELQLKTSGGKWTDIRSYLIGDTWSYSWDTTDSTLGFYTISLKASDGTNERSESIRIKLVDSESPQVGVTTPSQGGDYNCGETIAITGWVSDNTEITELDLSMGDDIWIDLIPIMEDGEWYFSWDTNGLPAGLYTISVKTSDGINMPVYETVQINLKDHTEPTLEITNPKSQFQYEPGDFVIIEGKVSDDVGVSSLFISTDSGITWIDLYSDLDSRGRWSYIWDTSELRSGDYVIHIKVSDGSNEVEDQLTIELLGEKIQEDEPTFPIYLVLFGIFAVMILIAMGMIAVNRRRKKD
jgi:hypothetical protein